MDAIKILGSVLASGVLGGNSSSGSMLGNILGSALGGGQQNSGMAGMLGSLLGGGSQQNSGMGGMLGSLLGGGQQQQPQAGGGLGDLAGMLGGLMGGGGQAANQQGGLAGMLGGLMGGGQQQQPQGGGLAGMLGGLMGGGQSQASNAGALGGLGSLLGGALGQYANTQNPTPETTSALNQMFPTEQAKTQANDQATWVIRAMINAAKADGQVDQDEQAKIVGKLNGLSQEEAAFIRNEFNAPLNVQQFVQSVPANMRTAVYAASLMAIKLDTKEEASYLAQLAQAFNMTPEAANQLHAQLGAPQIFS